MPAKTPYKSVKARERYLAHYASARTSWPVPSEERLVETSFGQTFVRVSGPVGATPLCMLPGIGSHGLTFGPLVAQLPASRTFVIDNIHDVGLSVETKAITSATDFSQWLDEVRTRLELETLHLLGLSYGGWIAAQYALRFPERVRRLVLLAPAGTVAPLPFGFIWRAVLCLLPSRAFMRNFLGWIAPELQSTPEGRLRFDAMVDEAVLATQCFRAKKMVPPVPLSDAAWTQLVSPSLLLVGEHEVIFSAPAAVQKIRRVAPRIAVETIPQAGHDFFVTRAHEVARRIENFLA